MKQSMIPMALATLFGLATTLAAAQSGGEIRKACSIVTAEEMGKILGSPVTTEANDRRSQTKCIYNAEGMVPYAELQFSWGDGETGMTAAGMMGRMEPGLTNPFAGIGDQAAQAGPMLFIRRGDDLIELVLSGVDIPKAAKQVYDILDKRLPKN
jgi:hypothetical protein